MIGWEGWEKVGDVIENERHFRGGPYYYHVIHFCFTFLITCTNESRPETCIKKLNMVNFFLFQFDYCAQSHDLMLFRPS